MPNSTNDPANTPARVRASTAFVLAQASHVRLDLAAAEKMAAGLAPARNWWSVCPLKFEPHTLEEALSLVCIVDAISFSYWGEPNWHVSYRGSEYNGTKALVACVSRVMERDPSALRPQKLRGIAQETAQAYFEGTGRIPLLAERIRILREVGEVLCSRFNGKYYRLAAESGGDAERLLDLLLEYFPSFCDCSTYQGTTIFFAKRAQLLVSDFDYELRARKRDGLRNIAALTACADYKIPQFLRDAGVLRYSRELREKLDAKVPLPSGSQEEVEIRAATVQAVEFLTSFLNATGVEATSIEISNQLWILSQAKSSGIAPYHRTRTIAY